MNTKDKILSLLSENLGSYISGQEIADTLFVTRACVWKSVKALKNEGYDIDAVTNKGYRLNQAKAGIDTLYIRNFLFKCGVDIPVFYVDEVTSTNDWCEQYSRSSRNDCIVISGSQTDGRGRRGRTFYSPKDSGLYFSLLIFPDKKIERLTDLTAYAASAVALSIDDSDISDEKTQIKWVNDIYLGGKKVAGILTEAHASLEEADNTHIIIGIGINIYRPAGDFPKEIRTIAGPVINGSCPATGTNIKNELVSKTAKMIYHYLSGGESAKKECLNTYREKAFLIGNYIKINDFTKDKRYALVTGITDDYHLMVRYDDDTTEELSSGEVSVVKY